MTALSEYERLESSGLWRGPPEEQNPDVEPQRREVIVSFGNASIVLSDKNDNPLAHWSLPAIQRLNPKERPAIYSPDSDAVETLELSDDTMIGAIEKISAEIERMRPRPGRLRWGLLGGFISAAAALAVFWLPDAMIRHTVSVVPTAKRLEIGQSLVADIKRVSGQACTTPFGTRALDALGTRLSNNKPVQLMVLPSGVTKATHLPGGFILLNRALIEDYEEPDVAAGYILAEQLRREDVDPLEPLLRSAGLRTTFTLLTTGDISDEALANYAEHLLTTPPAEISTQHLLAKFKAANLRSSPYAYSEDHTGETTIDLIEADPFINAAPAPLLTDGQWISLQSICGE